MRLYKGFLLFLLAAPGDVASLSCYSCNNVDNLNSCKTKTTCEERQSCFTRLENKGQSASFTLGCIQNEYCSSIPVYNNESKFSNGQLIQECEECCGVDQCNKDLHVCNYKPPPPPCSNKIENCAFWDEGFGICENIHKAKSVCRKFCKLCDIVDGNWADWSSWSSCDVTCGHGKHTKIRTCTNPAPAYKGLDCNGTNKDTKPCTRPLCPVHGGWVGWSSWEPCPVSCDIGIQKRHRKCTNPSPLRHGNHCFGESMDVRLCKQKLCDEFNGGWSEWNTWSTCSVSCDDGFKTRSRSCTNPEPRMHGKPCVGDNMQVITCNKEDCPLDGGWSNWDNWNNCSVSCGRGVKTRSRSCSNPVPGINGKPCLGDGMQEIICYTEDCKPDSRLKLIVRYVTGCSPMFKIYTLLSRTVTNEEGAYNSSIDAYVAHRDGMFTLYAKLCMTSQKRIHLDIKVGSKVYASALGYANHSNECPSTQAVAQLKSGDKVYVQWKY